MNNVRVHVTEFGDTWESAITRVPQPEIEASSHPLGGQ